ARLGRCIVNCCCRNNCRRMVAMAPGPSPRICLLLGVLFAFAALPAVARQPALMDANGGGASTCPLTADAEPDAEPVRPDKRAAASRRGGSESEAATRPPRWHSFLPGMIR